MSELPPIKLPRAAVGDQVVLTSEETGQAWNITKTNSTKTRRRLQAMTAPTIALPPPIVTPPPPAYDFFDDFTRLALDLSKWGPTEWPNGFSNSESDNMGKDWLTEVAIVNGQLVLNCERGQTPTGRAWRSAAICTRGKFERAFGRFGARVWYDKAQGKWPAVWLAEGGTSSGSRPEIDILESYPFGSLVYPFPRGGGPAQYDMTVHYRDSAGVMRTHDIWVKPNIDLTLGFHDFEIEWRPTFIAAILDGKEYGRIVADIPAVPMFLVVNNAMGGWAGKSDATTPSPSKMVIDRIWALP